MTSASMVPHRGISLSDLAAAEVSIEELGQWADLSFSRRHVYQLLEDSTHTRTHARAERDRERERVAMRTSESETGIAREKFGPMAF